MLVALLTLSCLLLGSMQLFCSDPGFDSVPLEEKELYESKPRPSIDPKRWYGGREIMAKQGEIFHRRQKAFEKVSALLPSNKRNIEDLAHFHNAVSHVSVSGSSSNSNISRDDADRSVQKRMSTKLLWTADVASWAQDLMSGMPVLMSGVAAWYVGVTDHTSGAAALSDTEIGIGPVPSEWMQSMEMHIVLTAIIWYLFGAMLGNTLVLVVNWFQGEEE